MNEIILVLLTISVVLSVVYVIGVYVMKLDKRIVFFAILTGFVCACLFGCGTTPQPPLVKIELDERVMTPCPVTLKKLEETDDVAVLAWANETLATYSKCAGEKNSIIRSIQEYNAKVDLANAKLKDNKK